MKSAAIRLVLLLAPALLPAQVVAAEPGNPARGERVFQLCAACHDLKAEAGTTPQGTSQGTSQGTPQAPPLAGIVGRRIASVAGFEYSEDLKVLADREQVWNAALLDRYIAAPFRVAPKTSMSFPGLPDDQERADLVAFLATVK